MSAFALLFDRRGAPASVDLLEPLLQAQAHHAVDGNGTRVGGATALGHLHFWTTPEEVGERQPLHNSSSELSAVFCGRLDNRDELATSLGIGAKDLQTLSDAALFLRAFERFREDSFARLLGPFAAVVVNEREQRIHCARDILGDRALFFHLRADLFAAASEEAAVLAAPGVSSRIDETSLARFFVPEEPAAGATFFADVQELPPGHALEITPDRFRQWRFGEVSSESRIRYRHDVQYVEHFLDLLSQAVGARLRSPRPAAVMMSGGLDSTSVAAVASRDCRRRSSRLASVSYVFRELPSCDESAYIAATAAACGLDSLTIAGDRLWPLQDIRTWPGNPNTPLEGPYRRLREGIYRAAAQQDVRVLLTGEFGDELYAGGEYWLRDLLRQHRWGSALAGVGRDRWLRLRGRRPGPHGLRSAVGRALGRTTDSFSSPSRPWFAPSAAARLGNVDWSPPPGRERPSQHWAVLHPSTAWGNCTEPYHAARAGVEVRRPFRDRRLIEFVLAIPAHQLYRPGESKWILRQAMRGLLPEVVRTRQVPTALVALLQRGLQQKEAQTAEALLFAPEALWRPYVQEVWLRDTFPRCLAGPDGAGLVVVWRCLCVELWRQRRLEQSAAHAVTAASSSQPSDRHPD